MTIPSSPGWTSELAHRHHGGLVLPAIEVMKKVQSHMNMGEVTIASGMTETSPVSTPCATDDPVERRVATVGQVMPHLEIKIVDAEGRAVPRGATGEFCSAASRTW